MKQNFEHASQSAEQGPEKLSAKEKFEVILKLFGTEAAKRSFIETCKKYVEERRSPEYSGHGENYVPANRRNFSPPKRANLHNRIMDTLKSLSLQKLAPLPEKILFEMADREIAGDIIEHWVLANEGEEDDDEDDEKTKKHQNESPTAFFHAKGGEY